MLTPGEVLDGRYEILELLARGGMGAVYRARRILLGDDVAIKVLSTPDDASLRERFLRESRAAAQLRHPHIVSVLDYDVDDQGHPFLVMEYLNGPSLLQRVALDRRLPVAEVLDIACNLCGALQLAHDAGVVHRDLKPANVVSHEYTPGKYVYKVVDFGLVNVREIAGALKLTMERQFLGTVAYASPEQLRGEKVDARSDIYSFCAMLYELLTGRPPFEHDDPFVVITKHLMREAQSMREVAPDIPVALDAVVLQGLSKDPARRPASMDALARALRDTPGGTTESGSTAAPGGAPEIRGYELGESIGAGRFGSEIYLGTHRALGTPVAIRVLRHAAVADWDAARDRFIREARAMQVTHPSVLHVRDFGEEPGLVYVVTDMVEGDSLAQRLEREGPLSWPVLERLTTQLVDAVAALHRRGAFVCGVSPRTIRLTTEDGEEQILVSSGGVGQVQDLLGTISVGALRGVGLEDSELPYVAPEVLMGEAPSVAADLFTIGALAHAMGTGAPPFLAPTLPQLLGAMLRGTPEPLSTVRADIPDAFSAAIMKTLSPVVADRPADARALAFLLP
ncbi:MAG TPA: serine/threonine-protein kinase [Luteitalea sp.]|nr:serine/threonine-protein kinase [Luteitalea sp.]